MKRLLYLLVVLLTLLLASCGEADPTTTINVIMTDFHFQPNQFTVPAGRKLHSIPQITEPWCIILSS